MIQFMEQLNALIDELSLTDEQVARECKVSLGTVRRWKAGESAPHPLGRESVFRVLERTRKA